MVTTTHPIKPEDSKLSSSDHDPNAKPELESLVRHTGPGLFTHEIYRRLVEQPVPLNRKYLADCLLLVQWTAPFQRHRNVPKRGII